MATSFLSYNNLTNLHHFNFNTTKIPQTRAYYDPLTISKQNNKTPFSGNGSLHSFGTTYSAGPAINNVHTSKRCGDFKVVQAIPETAEGFLSFLPADTPWYAWAAAAMVAIPLAIQRIVKLTNDVEAVAETIETIADTVGKLAEQVDKVADNMVEKLPEGKLREMISRVDVIAEATIRESQKVEDLMDKVEGLSNEMEDFIIKHTKKQPANVTSEKK